MKRAIKIILIPLLLPATIIGVTRFLVTLTWSLSKDIEEDIVLYLDDRLKKS